MCVLSYLTYLCLVSDEVNFWFGRLSGRRGRDHDIGLLLGLLHQNVHESLLLVLWLQRDDRRGRGRRSWRLDEHYLVMLLRGRHVDLLRWARDLIVRRRYMDVHMLVHYRLLRRPVLRRRRTVRRRRRSVRRRGRSVRRGRLGAGGNAGENRHDDQRSEYL